MFKFIHTFFLTRKHTDPIIHTNAVDSEISQKYVNVNKIAESIEKANYVLDNCKKIGNLDAIATWERIVASLQFKWRDAMVEAQSNGRYTFE